MPAMQIFAANFIVPNSGKWHSIILSTTRPSQPKGSQRKACLVKERWTVTLLKVSILWLKSDAAVLSRKYLDPQELGRAKCQ
jgi:hypothetical protein